MTENYGVIAPTDRGFEAVTQAFKANFSRSDDYRELGASFAVIRRGKVVVDMWGGSMTAAIDKPWMRGSLANVWSTTKGVTAIVMGMLVDRGLVRYEDTVARHWPEFAANGKGAITIAQAMSHQAGLPGFAEPITAMDQCDWDGCVKKLERQAPAWEPGTATSYHAMTYGWLAGEIVRRVAGKTIGQFVEENICGPLRAEVHIGLPMLDDGLAAEMIAPRTAPAMPSQLPDAAMMALANPQQDPTLPNMREWRVAEIPAANGQASAMGLARLYDGLLDGRLMSKDTLARMTAPATSDGRRDMLLGFTDCWGMGMALNVPGIYGPNPRAFGHSGWGGSFACADPDAGIVMAYVCNQMGADLVGDPRAAGLCKLVYEKV
jgi:CubicO group peptidase (beta-lactamase class C family)